MSQFCDVALEPGGVKTTRFAIPSADERSGPLTVGAPASTLVINAGALVHTLKLLVRDGMLSIGVGPSDKRSRLVSIDAAGTAGVLAADPFFKVAQKKFAAAFGQAEAHVLQASVRIIATDAFLDALDALPRDADR